MVAGRVRMAESRLNGMFKSDDGKWIDKLFEKVLWAPRFCTQESETGEERRREKRPGFGRLNSPSLDSTLQTCFNSQNFR